MKQFILDLRIDPLVPVPLVFFLALVMGVLTAWVYLRTGSRLTVGRRLGLLALRLLAVGLLLLILLQPSRLERLPADRREKVTLIALDSSRSMLQADSGKLSRFDAARELLWSSGVIARGSNVPVLKGVRLFEFGSDARPVTAPLGSLKAEDRSTRFHQSMQTLLGSLGPGERAHAVILLTDGHDFELANPSQTALLARNRQAPVHAVPFGGEGNVRDVSVRVTSYQPFHYAKQAIRLTASVRLLGCSYETLKVTLLREGKSVQQRSVAVREEAQVPLQFEVTEPVAGQFEYQIRVEPVGGETDAANNTASIYCNVVDKRIRVLVLEGQPYWDTTFLLRSLRRNERLEVDSSVLYANGRSAVLRTGERKDPFRLPAKPEDWNAYDVILLGRGLDAVLAKPQIDALEAWVEKTGGALVFARGDAFSGNGPERLQPVTWGRMVPRPGVVKVGRDGRTVGPMRLLEGAGSAEVPAPLGVYESSDRKPLAAALAVAEGGTEFPAMIHRRVGAGQVLSVGVDGLWRWAFNSRSDGKTGVYDKFWDQMVLWLMSGRDVMPDTAFTFRTDTGNVPLGEKVRFRVVPREAEALPASVPVTLRREGREVARLTCAGVPGGTRLTAEYVPELAGRYEAQAELPDGTRPVIRFAAYTDDSEDTEVAADPAYLRRLCEATRGRVLRPAELGAVVVEGQLSGGDDLPRTRKETLWDRAWLYWLMGGLFASDWFLRRRWGLC